MTGTIAFASDVRMDPPIRIAAAAPEDYEWCAGVMASTEPWITLRRDLAGCREALSRPGTELFVARDQDLPVAFILLAPYGLAILGQWLAASGQEGVFLVGSRPSA